MEFNTVHIALETEDGDSLSDAVIVSATDTHGQFSPVEDATAELLIPNAEETWTKRFDAFVALVATTNGTETWWSIDDDSDVPVSYEQPEGETATIVMTNNPHRDLPDIDLPGGSSGIRVTGNPGGMYL